MGLKKILTAGILTAFISTAACSAAEVSVKKDWLTTDMTVSGELGESFGSLKLMMYCIEESGKLSDMEAESEEQKSSLLISGVSYTVSNEDGTYEFPAIKVSGANGEYKFYVTAFGSDEVFSSEAVRAAQKSSIDAFVDGMQNKTGEQIRTLLDNEVETCDLGLEIPLYILLTDDGKTAAADALAGKTYTDIIDIMRNINKASVKPGIKYAGNVGSLDALLYPNQHSELKDYEAMIIEENGMSEYNKLSTFKALEKVEYKNRIEILAEALGNTEAVDLIEAINISTINYELANCSGYGDITDIIRSHKDDVLGKLDFESYNSSSYRNSLNKELLKNSFTLCSGLIDYIEKYLEDAGKTPPPSGGGSSSTGNKTTQPVLVTGQTEAKPKQDVSSERFLDMDGVEWAKVAVNYLWEKGIVSGREEGKFEPDANVTREEFAKMAVMAFSFYDGTARCSFIDVPEQEWYHSYVASGMNAGIINGVSENEFGTGRFISRQDMSVIIARAAGAEWGESDTGFTDDDKIAPYAIESVRWMKNKGYISGYSDGSFGPNRLCTRAEAAKIIYEAVN